MSSRLALGLVLAWFGLAGLLPAARAPLTPHQLQLKAIDKSKLKACSKSKKTKRFQRLCDKWGLT